MDGPSEFYSNIEHSKGREMTASEVYVRKLAKARGYEVGERRDVRTPTLSETFFGDAATIRGTSFSIEKERRSQKQYMDVRASDLSKRRKLKAVSERPSFF
jgi:hypothetical protein